MAGAILENLSTKKLSVFVAGLFVLQVVCFLLGGLIAPNPTAANTHLSSKCVDRAFNLKGWFQPWGPKQCQKVRDFEEATRQGIQANEIVFSVQMPNRPFHMTPWFQYLIGVLALDIVYDSERPLGVDPKVTLVIKLGSYDEDNKVTEIVSVNETRKLECTFNHEYIPESTGYQYDCDPVPLFELGSVHHSHYLLNIRLPVVDENNVQINTDIGALTDMHIVEIHQNGGFTKVWLSLKTALFPLVLFVMMWFWRRVMILDRPPHLLERTILALAIVVSVLNFPLEWIAIWAPAPGMTLVSDLRQGALYAMMFSFWIIFIGEHLMDQAERNRLKVYWRQVTAITFACFCLFIFDVCERGVQLSNPFYSIWNTETGKKLALAFIISAGTCGVLYFFFLCFMVYKVFKNISMRRATLSHMAKVRRLHYEGLIYRFRFFMFLTLLCAIMTVLFFILSQVNEGQWKWGEEEAKSTLQYTSAFFTGVYGMWNIYVLAVLVLYAPSHKRTSHDNGDANSGSNVEFELDQSVPSTSTGGETQTAPPQTQAGSALAESYMLLSKAAAD
ncbi:protein wntless homolog [Amphiura filiformis]|uniref:protein wntless homolog n=1 Tax=Amphiura filiformis TaxID=82378 RepID=UPI003B20FF3E